MKNVSVNPLKAVLLTVAGAASISVSGIASAVSCGDVLTSATVLSGDILSCAINPAVTLKEGASLDLNGYTISCDTPVGIGVRLVGAGRVLEDTAGGGSIEGCATGVSAEGDGGHFIMGVSTTLNSLSGVTLWSTGNTLEASYANGNTGMGIRLMGDGSQVRTTEATGNTLMGVKIVGNNSLLRDNDTSSNGASGIVVAEGNGGIIAENLSTDNGVNGIMMQPFAQTGWLIIGNDAAGNTGNDLMDQNVPACTGSVWVLNTFDNANDACIQ
ncbi:hypothetical protein Misp06_00124 [Microbulbifer sp. NBRC 101763]|uniref:right-handed parallel beta-helix repeat-containing protein n=1 Tax=unclassified Microbulbifer TaxID=2619833 RepID=UPI0024ACB0A7|nr:right-handed parallel beta-helix repeat-containing protein [Microbulbifer sp. MLAF003]WHI50093.1 hypothetical protein P3339_16810 [Microbulbifer sp. MLAF003]